MNVFINGKKPRALTLPELRQCQGMDVNEADVFVIALAFGADTAAVREWFNAAPAGESMALIRSVHDASGMGEGAQKSATAGDDAGPSRPGQ